MPATVTASRSEPLGRIPIRALSPQQPENRWPATGYVGEVVPFEATVFREGHGLLRVDLKTNRVTRLDDAPHSTSLGCDGIAWDRGAIVAVQNGVTPARITRFALDASGMRIVRADVLDRNSTVADEPTIGTVVGPEFVYVANSQWEKHDDVGRRVLARALTRPVLLAVPLPSMSK